MLSVVVEKLSKSYEDVRAVSEVSFSVKKGEIFGLLGPNGAGKTTLVGLLTTLISPDSGYAEVAGYSVEDKIEVRKRIGVVFQEPALDTRLTGRENLEFHAMLYGLGKERKDRIEKALELVDLKDKADVLVEKYSGGMKRKLEMARAFVHKPDVLFLDEPTLGLDVQTRRKIWDYVRFLKSEGVTVFLTTHYIEEAEKLCDRVAIMDKGKIVAIDSVENLKRMLGRDTVYVELSNHLDSKKAVEILEKIEGVADVICGDEILQVLVKRADILIPEILRRLSEVNIGVKAISMKTPDLEDVFVHLTGRRFS